MERNSKKWHNSEIEKSYPKHENLTGKCLEMSLVRELVRRFPLSPVRAAFGYGSSVFPQKGNDGKDRQIDMIRVRTVVQIVKISFFSCEPFWLKFSGSVQC